MDTTKIEGYENMTPEEKIAALESFEIPDLSDENTRLKNALNKASSETAEYKRQLKEKMSEQERAEAEAQERARQNEEKIAEYERKEKISTYKAEYLALGYDAELATVAAEAKANGDTSKEFECLKTFNEKREAQFKATLIQDQPTLTQGSTPDAPPITKEEIFAVKDKAKRLELIAEHNELFRRKQ